MFTEGYSICCDELVYTQEVSGKIACIGYNSRIESKLLSGYLKLQKSYVICEFSARNKQCKFEDCKYNNMRLGGV